MAAHATTRQRAIAATFALGCASGMAVAASWTGMQLVDVAFDTTDAVVVAAFMAIATLCSARLSVVCFAAARDILTAHHDGPASVSAQALSNPVLRSSGYSGRTRAASFFLALAALTTVGAGAATAAPVSITASTSAPSPDFTATTSPASASPSSRPDATKPSTPTSASPARCESTPAPGWTPPPKAVDTDACRLLIPGTGSAAEPEHVVLHGQSLWSIAAAHLPENASAEVVAESVRAWIGANPTFHDHPDLIHPGDVLKAPNSVTTGRTR